MQKATIGQSGQTPAKQQHDRFFMSSIFAFSPDSFWLRVPAQEENIAVRPLVTSFGETDELLCYVDEVFLGKLMTHGERPGKAISLLPTLDRNRDYPWPTSEIFFWGAAACFALRTQCSLVVPA